VQDEPKLRQAILNLNYQSLLTVIIDLFKREFPQHDFSIIMEATVSKLDKWKNYAAIIKNHAIYIL